DRGRGGAAARRRRRPRLPDAAPVAGGRDRRCSCPRKGRGTQGGLTQIFNALKIMGLLEDQKAERRARILATARRLIAERGFDGLTMRELASASRVSVPTLYNLFGGKHALLLGELEETFARVDASMRAARGERFVERMIAGCEAANDD